MGEPILRMRADVFYVAVDDGVWVRTNHGSFTLRGRGAAGWLERLAPLLDEGASLPQLSAGLGEAHRRYLTRLVGMLREHGAVVEVADPATTVPVPAPLRDRFAQQLAYLEHYVPDAGAALFAVRDTPVAVYGTGHACAALARALADSGFGSLRLLPADAPEPARQAASELMARFAAARVPLIVEVTPGADPGDAGEGHLVALVEHDAPLDGQALQRAAFDAGSCAWIAQGIGDALLIKGSRPGSGPCLECAVRRCVYEPAGRAAPERLGVPATAIAAAVLAQDLFRFTTGVPGSEVFREAALVDLGKLSIWRTEVSAHPLCSSCGPVAVPTGSRSTPIAVPTEPQAASAAPFHPTLGGRCFGVVPAIGPEDLTQLPLVCCVARFKPATVAHAIPAAEPVASTGLDYATAWNQALRHGVEEYILSLPGTAAQAGVSTGFPGAVLRCAVRHELATWAEGPHGAEPPLTDRAAWYLRSLELYGEGHRVVSVTGGRLARCEVHGPTGTVLARGAHLTLRAAAESALAAALARAANPGRVILPPIPEPEDTDLDALVALLDGDGLRIRAAMPDPVLEEAGLQVALLTERET